MRGNAMQHPAIFVVVFIVTSILMLSFTFKIFKVQFTILDVTLAALCAGLATLIPYVGPYASIVVMAAILNYRTSAELMPDIVVAVAVSRLFVIPPMLFINLMLDPPK
jgi:predicted PurR-regulated permease PerM